MDLYSVARNGKSLYFYGSIPDNLFSTIEALANSIEKSLPDADFCNEFTRSLYEKLSVSLVHLPVSFVFRVR